MSGEHTPECISITHGMAPPVCECRPTPTGEPRPAREDAKRTVAILEAAGFSDDDMVRFLDAIEASGLTLVARETAAATEPRPDPAFSTFMENAREARENGYDRLCAHCGVGVYDDSDIHERGCPEYEESR